MKQLHESFNEFTLNENIRKRMPELLAKIEAASKEFPPNNKRSALQKLAKRNKGSETFDQDTKFTYSPDGEVFIVYDYADQDAVDNAIYQVKGKNHDVDKQKEKLVLQPGKYGVYAETGRPGYRVYNDGSKDKIGKDGRTRY